MSRAATSTSLLRTTNVDIVVEALRDGQSWRMSELQSHTGLSRPTINAVARDLIDMGLATESIDPSVGLGRPARRLSFVPSAGYVGGVDIRRDSIHAVVANLLGEIAAQHTLPISPGASRRARITSTHTAIERAAQDIGLRTRDLLSVAVGTPGVVDPDTGTITMCEVLADWVGFRLTSRLAKAFCTEVIVENDANLAGVAEQWCGAAAGCNHAITLLVGERPGAGIIVNGELVHGFRGWAGELFHWQMWHRQYSQIGIAAVPSMQAELASLRSTLNGPSAASGSPPFTDSGTVNINLREALAALAAGESSADRALDRFLTSGAWIISTMASLLGPERIIINGIPQNASTVIVDIWQRTLAQIVPHSRTELQASQLGDEAVVRGAIRNALAAAQQHLSITLI